MNKIGYALVDIRDHGIAARWHNTIVDANGRPQMCFRIPGTALDVHCPEIGSEYGDYRFVERFQHDPGAPGAWHSSVEVEVYDGRAVVLERRYSEKPDLVPPSISMMQARLTLLRAKLLDKVNAEIAALDPAEEENQAVQIMWEYAAELSRHAPELARIAKIVGLTDEEIDNLFRAAAGG